MEWAFCGLDFSFGAAGKGDLRVKLEPERLLTETTGLAFCERETLWTSRAVGGIRIACPEVYFAPDPESRVSGMLL